MAFETIDPNKIKVGDPITKELLDTIKGNFDDLDTRVNNLSITASGIFYILNGDFSFMNYTAQDQYIFYYAARRSFTLNEFRVQLFTKGGLTSGFLTFDLEVGPTTQNSLFTSILDQELSFNFAIDSNYVAKNAVFEAGQNSISVGQIIRIKVSTVPIGFKEKIMISLGGE